MKSGDTVKILARPHGTETLDKYKHLIGRTGVVREIVDNRIDKFVSLKLVGKVHWWKMEDVECVK